MQHQRPGPKRDKCNFQIGSDLIFGHELEEIQGLNLSDPKEAGLSEAYSAHWVDPHISPLHLFISQTELQLLSTATHQTVGRLGKGYGCRREDFAPRQNLRVDFQAHAGTEHGRRCKGYVGHWQLAEVSLNVIMKFLMIGKKKENILC